MKKFNIKNINYYLKNYSERKKKVLENINQISLVKISELIERTYKSKKKIFVCGNGGSSSVSNHWECDHREGIKRSKKFKPKSISLVSNTDIITAIANDNGFEKIFSNSFENLSDKGDLLICFSVSGNSKNIIEVLKLAKKKKINSILFSGFSGGNAKKYTKYKIIFKSNNFGIVEDCFQSIMHILAQYIELKSK